MTPIDLGSPALVAAAIRRTRKPGGQGDSHDFAYAYRAPNGRRFELREYEDGQVFLSEFRPNGRARLEDGTFGSVSGLVRAARDPNGFVAEARALGFDEDRLVRGGAGLGIASRHFPDIEAAAAAIRAALDANAWYDATDRALLADPGFQARLAADDAESRIAWEAAKKAEHERAVAEGKGLFQGLHSMHGPLPKERCDMILAYLNGPSEAGWDAIAHTCVKGMRTLWQAWLAVDPEAPRSKSSDGAWPRIPGVEVLREAIETVAGVAPGDRPSGEAEIVTLRR
jgi:hypothetical protein